MALTMPWDSTYEARPPSGINRASLDNEMRLMRKMTRQVMEQEHNFGPSTSDDGRHRAGYVTLFGVGDSTARDAVADVPDGALWLLDDGTNYRLQAYKLSTTSWVTVAYPDHGALSNLLDNNAHPEFLLKSGDTTNRSIDANSDGIYIPDADVTEFGLFVTSEHLTEGHGALPQPAVSDLPYAKIKKESIAVTFTDETTPNGSVVEVFPTEVTGTRPSISHGLVVIRDMALTVQAVDDSNNVVAEMPVTVPATGSLSDRMYIRDFSTSTDSPLVIYCGAYGATTVKVSGSYVVDFLGE